MKKEIIFYAFLIFISCSNKKDNLIVNNILTEIEINSLDIPDTTDISSIIQSIKIIKLKENNKGIIGGIENLIVTNNKFVLFDPFFSNSVVIYNKNGDFEKNLVKMGGGPNELTKLSGIWTNENGEIEVYDNFLNRINVYDTNFNFSKSYTLKSEKLFGPIMKINSKPNRYVSYSGYNGFKQNGRLFKIGILDSLFRIENTYFEYPYILNQLLIPTPISPFFKTDNKVTFTQDFDPSVYTIQPNGNITKIISLKYTLDPFPIDYEKKLIEPNYQEFKSENLELNNTNEILSGYTGFRGPWLETKKYSYFTSFDKLRNPFFTILDNKSKKVLFQGKSFKESKDYSIQIPPHFYATSESNNKFYGFYEGYITLMLLQNDSPFYNMVKEDPQSFYIIEVSLK